MSPVNTINEERAKLTVAEFIHQAIEKGHYEDIMTELDITDQSFYKLLAELDITISPDNVYIKEDKEEISSTKTMADIMEEQGVL